MARNEQLIRQHKILQLLEDYRFGRTLEEIRDDLVADLGLTSLHARSVRRDIEALQAAGIDVQVHATSRGKVWKLGPRARESHAIAASATELLALSLGRDLLLPLVGTPLWQGIESFWNKVKGQLPRAVLAHYEKYRRVFHVAGMPAKSYASKHGFLKSLHRAILQHRVVEVDYQPPGRPAARRQIEPYAMVFYQSSLYVVAADHTLAEDQDRLRHWKLDRFQRVTLLDKRFAKDDSAPARDQAGRGIGVFSGGAQRSYRIKISAKAAAWVIEDPWHPDQTVKTCRDGSMELTVPAMHDLEIIPRVLALGEEAELLSPASCRLAIARQVRHMTERYADEPDAKRRSAAAAEVHDRG